MQKETFKKDEQTPLSRYMNGTHLYTTCRSLLGLLLNFVNLPIFKIHIVVKGFSPHRGNTLYEENLTRFGSTIELQRKSLKFAKKWTTNQTEAWWRWGWRPLDAPCPRGRDGAPSWTLLLSWQEALKAKWRQHIHLPSLEHNNTCTDGGRTIRKWTFIQSVARPDKELAVWFLV